MDIESLQHPIVKAAIVAMNSRDRAMVSCLIRWLNQKLEVYQTMLASEQVLRREWDTPEEDAAWADL